MLQGAQDAICACEATRRSSSHHGDMILFLKILTFKHYAQAADPCAEFKNRVPRSRRKSVRVIEFNICPCAEISA